MIFFVLPKTDPLDLDLIEVPDNDFASRRLQKKAAFVLIPWNQVYSSMEAMLIAIRDAAQQDPVCLSYLAQFKRFYAIDLLQTDNPLFEKMWDTLFYWSHPLIGNLIHSPKVRPVRWDDQYLLNWLKSNALSDASKKLLVKLAEEMPKLRRASRDQCRICSNIVELARAFLGEMTCFFTRKLEKVLALRLCSSQTLYDVQRQMLNDFTSNNTRVDRVLATISTKGIAGMEYGSYYLPREASLLLTGDAAVDLFRKLFTLAIGGEVNQGDGLDVRCIRAWLRIPPVIRCAALMNDIRKLDSGWSKSKEPTIRNSMQVPDIADIKSAMDRDLNYQAGPSADRYGVRFLSDKPDLAWSWNRDEAHDATITYRYNLCPLWGGPSGHMAGNIAYWKFALGDRFPSDGATALCSALFSLWRLYYDRRISGNHTLVETFEATLLDTPPQDAFPVNGFISISALEPWPPDSYEAVKSCVFSGSSAVDPVRLIRLLMISNPTSIRGVNETLKIAQESVARSYWLPQWSHELSETVGTDVIHVVPDVPLHVVLTEDDPQTAATTQINLQFDSPPGNFVLNVGPQGLFTVFDVQQSDPTHYTATTTALPYGYSSKAEICVIKSEDRVLIYPIGKSIVGGQSITLDVQLI